MNWKQRKLKMGRRKGKTMKKLLVLILLVTMLLPVIVTAEFDLASMTDEQLMLLNKELMAELFSREKSAFIPMGTYVVGENIPEGEYELSLDTSKSNPLNMIGYYVYADSMRIILVVAGAVDASNSVGRLVLKKGNILELQMGGALLRALKAFVVEFK